ncbi:MAG: nucleoside recognition protein [Desulfomonile tiedjei]|uniref:Nucleoside recognition protein n=1 Tax=Desulfomonile tiedjei TaxID=2358 RepID=A0A9D6V4S4_9BACT|nr:nucleoside recognition protein [Desulfomonile tiedjei]
MLNVIWLVLLVGSVVVSVFTGHLKDIVPAVTESAESAFKMALGFTGVMALWLGIMKIAEESGLVELITRAIAPIMRYLFPEIPRDHPAMGSMAMNMVANMLGLNNAATPLGIRAMKDLDSLNARKDTATDSMCMFLAINTSSLQLVPAGAIALLAAGGSSDPTIIVFPALLATIVSTVTGVLSAKFLSRMRRFREDKDRG